MVKIFQVHIPIGKTECPFCEAELKSEEGKRLPYCSCGAIVTEAHVFGEEVIFTIEKESRECETSLKKNSKSCSVITPR